MSWLSKIWGFVKRLFQPKASKTKKQIASFSASPYLERIYNWTMGTSLKLYSHRYPETRVVTVECFSDAYRHLLRMCDQKQLSYRYRAGYCYHTVTLPEGYGCLVLTDNVGYRKDGSIAILKIDVADAAIQVKEIRYKLMN